VAKLARVLILLVVVTMGVVALRLSQRGEGPLVVSGFVEADRIRVGSRVGGRVAVVAVEEGDRIAKGDVLLELEAFDLIERRAAAEAELAAAQAGLQRLEVGFRPEEIAQSRALRDRLAAELERLERGPREQEIQAARENLRLAEASRELAEQEVQRAQKLHESGVSSAELLDRFTANQRVAAATVAVREQELAILLEGTRREDIAAARAELAGADAALQLAEAGFRTEDVDRARAQVQGAQAALASVDRRVEELTIVAPVSGVVEALDLEPGDLVAPDAPALSLLDPNRLWVRCYVPANRVALAVGDEVAVRVDAFGPERFRGRIMFIAPEAEFTPGNVQTPEDRSKLVFRVKVELFEGLERLRPGMSADVHLEEDVEVP